jgi:hypothetical protein
VKAQECTLALHDTAARIRACVLAPEPGAALDAGPAPEAMDAAPDGGDVLITPSSGARLLLECLQIALGGVRPVMTLHFHPARLAELAERSRVKKRMVTVAVNHVVDAARIAHEDPQRERPRCSVVLLGGWFKDVHAPGGAFPLKRFVDELGTRCIVIVLDEFRTSSRCTHCSGPLSHPMKADKVTEFRGTVYCKAKGCGSFGRFENRDAVGACNIAFRFICGFFVGGSLGKPVWFELSFEYVLIWSACACVFGSILTTLPLFTTQ